MAGRSRRSTPKTLSIVIALSKSMGVLGCQWRLRTAVFAGYSAGAWSASHFLAAIRSACSGKAR